MVKETGVARGLEAVLREDLSGTYGASVSAGYTESPVSEYTL
jgi:hypothetical protein